MVRHLVVTAAAVELGSLTRFAAQAAEEAGFETQLRDRIELVMDEACSNIIEHAYAGRKGTIAACAEISPKRELVLKLVDQGRAFVPAQVPAYMPCPDPDHVKLGGLGLFLMQKIMDEVFFEFDVPGVGNRLTMVKRI